MNSVSSCHYSQTDCSIKVISVFDQDSKKTFQQLIEDAFVYLLNSDIDNSLATRYIYINSR